MRAYHYMRIMDMWGNVPIITTVRERVNPETSSRGEVFDFVRKELRENVDLLQPLSQNVVDMVSQAEGYSMLSELYLNAGVWTGTPMWYQAIAAADKVISGEPGGLNGPIRLDED